jgi:hypothetical protein
MNINDSRVRWGWNFFAIFCFLRNELLFTEILMLLKGFNIKSLITCLTTTFFFNDDKNFYALHKKKLSGRLVGGQEYMRKDKKKGVK